VPQCRLLLPDHRLGIGDARVGRLDGPPPRPHGGLLGLFLGEQGLVLGAGHVEGGLGPVEFGRRELPLAASTVLRSLSLIEVLDLDQHPLRFCPSRIARRAGGIEVGAGPQQFGFRGKDRGLGHFQSAAAWSTAISNDTGSIDAITSPRVTLLLKSAGTSMTWPETWVPTRTVATGSSVPVATTAESTSPRATSAKR
jgi:hypothetical protein